MKTKSKSKTKTKSKTTRATNADRIEEMKRAFTDAVGHLETKKGPLTWENVERLCDRIRAASQWDTLKA